VRPPQSYAGSSSPILSNLCWCSSAHDGKRSWIPSQGSKSAASSVRRIIGEAPIRRGAVAVRIRRGPQKSGSGQLAMLVRLRLERQEKASCAHKENVL
jgi:hypothetical protein